MLSIEQAIRSVERDTDARCIDQMNDPENDARIVLRFQYGDNITTINLERRRLRQINRSNARGIIERTRASLHREVR